MRIAEMHITPIAISAPPLLNAAGLGIELDRAAPAALHQNYLACGLTRRDDEVEMQKVQPGWKFAPSRWRHR